MLVLSLVLSVLILGVTPSQNDCIPCSRKRTQHHPRAAGSGQGWDGAAAVEDEALDPVLAKGRGSCPAPCLVEQGGTFALLGPEGGRGQLGHHASASSSFKNKSGTKGPGLVNPSCQ